MAAWNWQSVPDHVLELITRDQAGLVKDLRRTSSMTALAKERGVAERGLWNLQKRTKLALVAAGYDPERGMTETVSHQQSLQGRSAYVKIDPETGQESVTAYWQLARKNDRGEALIEAIEGLIEGIQPFQLVSSPKILMKDVCVEYGITDFHLGQHSWGKECGEDWDIDIAERVFLEGFCDMMNGSPDSEQAIFLQLGDFLDWDGTVPVTPTAKNVLDADTRYPLLVQTAIRCCVKGVEMLLHKHKNVHVICAEGNHDISGSIWLREIMSAIFRKNKRVTVETSNFPFYSFPWGETFLGYHHGHLVKMEGMASKFYSEIQFRKQMSIAKYIILKCGHLHKQQIMEMSGAIIERLPTLNARGAHGARGFDSSQRAAHAIAYHKERGEISRKTIIPR